MFHLAILLLLAPFRQDPDEEIKKANAALARGEVDAAILEYTRIYEKNPRALGALVNRAAARMRKGDFDGAIDDATRAIEGGANVPEVFINRGQARKAKGDFASALKDLTLAITLEPKRVSSYLARADVKGESGDVDGALLDCEKALRIDAKSAAAFAKRAQWRRPKADWAGAQADATQAIKLDPRNALAYFYRGTVHMQKERFDAARKDFDQAIDCDPSVAAFWDARGALRQNQEDSNGALGDFNEAVRLAPTNPEYLFDRAAARMSTGELWLAIEDCEKALKIAPERWGLRPEAIKRLKAIRLAAAFNEIQKAQELEKKGEFDKAIDAYQVALRLEPDTREIRDEVVRGYTVRGKARVSQRNYAGAVKDYTLALKLNPSSAAAYGGRGFAHFENYAFSDAIKDFTKAFELNPKDLGTAYYLGSSYRFSKKQADAIQWYSKALEISPNHVPCLIMRGAAKFELGRYDDALEDCEQALKVEPGQHGALFHRASCYLAKGEWEKAKADYERVVRDAPKDWDWRTRATAILSILPDLAGEKSGEPLAGRLVAKARALMEKKDYTPAIGLLEEVLRLDCKSKEGYEAIALAHHFRDDNSKGDHRAALDRAFELVELGQGVSFEVQKLIITRSSSLVLAGLLWLARHQFPDGRWSASDFGELCQKDGSLRCEGKGPADADVRSTGFVLLALLGAGYSQLSKDNYGIKPMGETVKAGLKWLMGRQNPDGSFVGTDAEGFTEDHAIAAMAMSEAYGMTESALLKEPATRAIEFLRSTFIPGKGWSRRKDGREADPQATGWALLALWSGMMSEIPEAGTLLEEGFSALEKQTFQGEPLKGGLGELLAMAVAACRRKPLAGNELALRLDKMIDLPPLASDRADPLRMFVSVLAVRFGGDDRWAKWKAQAKDVIMKSVRKNDENFCPTGSFNVTSPREVQEGRLLATTLNVLSLELYYGYKNAFGTLSEPAEKK